ncbi:MAG: hypothetical protein AAF439_05555 [Pseudomonadota bacterium]
MPGAVSFGDTVREFLSALPISDPPTPWRKIATVAVGGSYAFGFPRDAETILACSDNGQSLFDCTTGERLYRNRDENGYRPAELKADFLDGSKTAVDTMGKDGGGLRLTTDDGWSIECIAADWPGSTFLLYPPGAGMGLLKVGKAPDATVLCRELDCLAFGFSWTGKSLVWADRADLTIWHRG